MGGDCLGNICSVPVFLGTPERTRIGYSKATAKMWSSKSLPHEEESRMDCSFCLHSPVVSPSSCLKSGRSAMVVVAGIRSCVTTGSSPLLFFESMPAWYPKAWSRQLRLVITDQHPFCGNEVFCLFRKFAFFPFCFLKFTTEF